MTTPRLGVTTMALAVVFGSAFAACGSGVKAADTATDATAYKVMMRGYAFEPAYLTVPAGATVTWTNMDDAEHDVISGANGKADGVFASPAMTKGATFSFKFEKAATYHYYCGYHSGMTGTIVVTGD